MLATYNDLVAYFENMPALISGIKSVTVGADEAVLDGQTSNIRYPHLWVETPAIAFVGTDDNPAVRYSFALVILLNEGQKQNRVANQKLSAALNLMTSLYNRLLTDADNGMFDLVLSDAPGEAVRAWSGDNAYGWRLDPVKLDLPRDTCGDPIDEYESPAITGATFEYIIPAGRLLLAIYVRSTVAQTAVIGTTLGGDELTSDLPTEPLEYGILAGLTVYAENDTTIYFSNLSGTNTIRIWTVGGGATV